MYHKFDVMGNHLRVNERERARLAMSIGDVSCIPNNAYMDHNFFARANTDCCQHYCVCPDKT
jgi:hypothetical protein